MSLLRPVIHVMAHWLIASREAARANSQSVKSINGIAHAQSGCFR